MNQHTTHTVEINDADLGAFDYESEIYSIISVREQSNHHFSRRDCCEERSNAIVTGATATGGPGGGSYVPGRCSQLPRPPTQSRSLSAHGGDGRAPLLALHPEPGPAGWQTPARRRPVKVPDVLPIVIT